MKIIIVCLFVLTGFTPAAHAWGCAGHQTVALIAARHLNKKAKAQVEALLAQPDLYSGIQRFCPDTQLDKMAYFATWADDYRSVHPETGPWHFIDIPLTDTAKPDANAYCGSGCVTHAINDQLAVLKNPDAAAIDKARALAFVIHFVGDLHQPLHSSDNNDRGGNCVPVKVFGKQPVLDARHPELGNYRPNLHSAWDVDLLDHIASIPTSNTDPAVLAFSKQAEKKYYSKKKGKLPPDPLQWAWESNQVARKITYGDLPVAITFEQPVAINDCTDDNNISSRMLALHESIDDKYLTAVSPTVQQQLALAGARLAALLNGVWH